MVDSCPQHGPERRLLLALVGRRGEASNKEAILSLFRQVSWQNFLATTSDDLYPYLAFRLESFTEYIDKTAELEQLFRARQHTAVRNLRLRYELGRVIEALRQAGIPALALKGIVLAYTIYRDSSLRPMSDLDLLVPPGKRERALEVLQELGFEYPEIVQSMNRDHCWRLDSEQEFAPGLWLRNSRILVEVHSQLGCSEPVLPIPIQEFWNRSVAVDLNGLTVRTLSPEDSLFHLCLHQSRSHLFEKGLLPLIDVGLLIDSHKEWHWSRIAAQSIRCGCATWMYLTLRTARDLTGASVPDSFLQMLPRPAELRRLLCLAEEQILSAGTRISGVPGFLPALMAETSWRSRAHRLFVRMRMVSREEIEPRPTLAGFLRRRRLAFKRLLVTFRIKIPYYFRAWKSGYLNSEAIGRTAQQLRKANILFRLIAEQEASWAKNKDQVGQN